MKLEPEEREVGGENFYATIGSPLTRGKLLEESARDALATKHGLGSKYFGYGEADRPVRVGMIGTGDEGGVLIGALNPKYVQVVAIADIRPYNVYRALHGDKSSPNARVARPGLMKIYSWPDEETARQNLSIYEGGYEALLDDEKVEAVIIALPLHLHAEAAIKALRKGKHVLTEKLMAHDVHQCKEMARVAKTEKLLLAVGHQRHYSVLYQNAVELVKKNLIGEIHHIRAQWHRGNLPGKDSWQPPLPDDAMARQLADAQTRLGSANETLVEARKAAKKRLPQKTLDLLEKWDGELAVKLPKLLADARKLLSDESARDTPDADAIAKHKKEIEKHEKRIRDINREYPKRLGLDPELAKNLDVAALETKVEILTHRLKDRDIATKVKDYGYIDREVGGQNVSALEELIRWRLWDRTGGGLMAELGSHQLDAAGIFISALRDDGKKAHPLSVTAVGGRHIFPHDRDIDDHVYCSFEYPGPNYDPDKAPEKKIVVTYSSINGNGFGGYGETVLGTKGSLILDKEKEVLLYSKWITDKYVRARGRAPKLELVEADAGSDEALLGRRALKGPLSRGYTEEIEHWAWAVRQRADSQAEVSVPLRCSPKVALADAVIALTTNIAIGRGKEGENCRIDFKEEWFDPDSDETPEGIAPDVDRPEYQV